MTKPATKAEMFLMRIGDDERLACVDVLTEHHVRGRLGVVEFERRREEALAAVTEGDLVRLTADLPHPLARREPSRRGPTAARFGRTALRKGAPAAVVVGAAAGTAAAANEALYHGGPEIFVATLASGAVGYATHWVVTRLRRG